MQYFSQRTDLSVYLQAHPNKGARVSSTNNHVRPWDLKFQQKDLMQLLRRPVEPAAKQTFAHAIFLLQQKTLLAPAIDAAQKRRADQNSDAERDADRDKRTVLDFTCNPPQRAVTVFGAEIERLIAEAPGLVAGNLATLAETTHHVA